MAGKGPTKLLSSKPIGRRWKSKFRQQNLKSISGGWFFPKTTAEHPKNGKLSLML
jgi:hypothetical protein